MSAVDEFRQELADNADLAVADFELLYGDTLFVKDADGNVGLNVKALCVLSDAYTTAIKSTGSSYALLVGVCLNTSHVLNRLSVTGLDK